MTDVRHKPEVGQDPAAEARSIVDALRSLAFDAVAPKGERHHSKHHLRRTLRAHFRALDARINVLAPRPVEADVLPAD